MSLSDYPSFRLSNEELKLLQFYRDADDEGKAEIWEYMTKLSSIDPDDEETIQKLLYGD